MKGNRFSSCEKLSLVSIAIAALLLTLGYALSDWWVLAPGMVVLGGAWAWRQCRGGPWASAAGLGLVVTSAAAGLWLGVRAPWLLGALVAALGAWDLDQFEQHLRQAGRVEGRQEMEGRHLVRLALALGVGLPLGMAALQVQLHFSFLVALLLAALATLGIGELILYLRQGKES